MHQCQDSIIYTYKNLYMHVYMYMYVHSASFTPRWESAMLLGGCNCVYTFIWTAQWCMTSKQLPQTITHVECHTGQSSASMTVLCIIIRQFCSHHATLHVCFACRHSVCMVSVLYVYYCGVVYMKQHVYSTLHVHVHNVMYIHVKGHVGHWTFC